MLDEDHGGAHVAGVGDTFFKIAGRYECRQKIGEGSTGVVWLARDSVREETLALRWLDEDLVRGMGGFKEAAKHLRVTTHFRHPSVLSVFDYAPSDGVVYISMEYLRGQTLRDHFAEIASGHQNPLDERAVMNIVHTIIDVLQAGALTGRAHGGIKPENIFLIGEGQVCLSEYGLHHLLPSAALKSSAALLRTGHYLAPEIYEQEIELNFQTDQFALGTLWRELIQHSDMQSDAARFDLHRTVIQMLTATQPEQRFRHITGLQEAFQPVSCLSTDKRMNQETFVKRLKSVSMGWKSWWIWSPLVLLLIPVCLGLLFQSTPAISPVIERAAIREKALELEMQRIRLFRDGFRMEELGGRLEALFSQMTTIETLMDFNSFSDEDLPQKGKEIHRALDAQRRQIEQAQSLVQAFTEGKAWLVALDPVREAGWEQAGHWQQSMGSALTEALASLDLLQWDAALGGLKDELLKVKANVLSAFENERRAALESRGSWRTLLKASGVPYAEPTGDLSLALEKLDQRINNVEPDMLSAILEAQRIRESFDRWNHAWQKLPQTPSNAILNSLGMAFVPVGEMQVSIWETRVIDFAHFVQDSGFDANRSWRDEASTNTPAHPVSTVARYDAVKFCEWLTQKEHDSGLLPDHAYYALPTDREWSRLAGMDDEVGEWPQDRHRMAPGILPWEGDADDFSNHGNYYTSPSANEANDFFGKKDRFHRTAPVGQFPSNAFGLYDVGGNVMEWVSTEHRGGSEEWYTSFFTLRGGGFRSVNPIQMHIGHRVNAPSGLLESGFRCVLKVGKEGP